MPSPASKAIVYIRRLSGNPPVNDDINGECIIYSRKPKMSSANKHRIRKIHIKYDFIGFIPVKSLMRYAEESEQAQGK